MLDTEVDALLNVAIADDLVDDDTDSTGGDVVYYSSAAEKDLFRWQSILQYNIAHPW